MEMTITEQITKMKELIASIEVDAPKALEGNKLAARRARGSLNDLKKMTTPMRILIQDTVKAKFAAKKEAAK